MSKPWLINESDFYELESKREQFQFLLRYAILAPSTHNSQPWLFKIVDGGIEVYADYEAALPFDPNDRELFLSLGAAITNLCVASAWFGFETSVLYEQRPEQSLPVALVAIRETCAPNEDLRALFPAIRKRHTNWNSFSDEPISGPALTAICDLVDQNPGTLCFLRWNDRKRIGDLIADGDRKLRANALQTFRDRRLTTSAAALLLITADDDRIALIRAGEILERVLLTITKFGLSYSFLNQPIQVKELRGAVQDIALTQSPPQLLLRIGRSDETPRPAPRRSVESVMTK